MENISPEPIISYLLKNNPNAEVEIIREAFDFSVNAHKGQTRDIEDLPYAIHPYRTALYLARNCKVGDVEAIVIALLHDVIEDCPPGTGESILKKFGKNIYESVMALSKPKEPGVGKAELRRMYNEKVKTLHLSLLQIKLADRVDNLKSVHEGKKRRVIEDTMETYYPIAERFFPNIAEDMLSIMEEEHSEHSDIF